MDQNIEDARALIDRTIASIRPPDGDVMARAALRMDGLLKPPGSLGRIEELGIRLAGIQGTDRPGADRRLSLVYAADHGVTAEGVSASPAAVTAVMTGAFCGGRAAINVFADLAGAVLRVIDVGVATPYEIPAGLIVRRIRPGTGNIRFESAMSRDEAIRAVAAGIETAAAAIAETGAQLVGVGEMGIGNTTAAAALTAVFTGRDPVTVTGGGTGIGGAALKRKVRVVRDAIALHRPDPADPLGVLAALGGLEIGAMCGAMLAAASAGAMVILDGFISGAAALCACALAPAVRESMVLGHLSAEPGHRAIAAKLELLPVLDLGLRLGEGTGAALAMNLVAAGAAVLSRMGTLEQERIRLETPQ